MGAQDCQTVHALSPFARLWARLSGRCHSDVPSSVPRGAALRERSSRMLLFPAPVWQTPTVLSSCGREGCAEPPAPQLEAAMLAPGIRATSTRTAAHLHSLDPRVST